MNNTFNQDQNDPLYSDRKILHGEFDYADGKLSFTCTTQNVSFDEVLAAITAMRDECQRQIDNQNLCPHHVTAPVKSTVSSACKEVKTMLELLDEESKRCEWNNWYEAAMYGTIDQINDIPQTAGRMYASQFKSPPASTEIPEISDEIEIEFIKKIRSGISSKKVIKWVYQELKSISC